VYSILSLARLTTKTQSFKRHTFCLIGQVQLAVTKYYCYSLKTSSFTAINMYTTLPTSTVSTNNTIQTGKYIYVLFDLFAWKKRDIRLDEFPLMASIWPTVFLSVTYVFIVKVVAPMYMRGREPIDCYFFMTIYNIVNVVGSFVISYSIFINNWDGGYVWSRFKYIVNL
jgi:hypothetical protein